MRKKQGATSKVLNFFEKELLPIRSQLEAAVQNVFDLQNRLFNQAKEESVRTTEHTLALFRRLTAVSILLAFALAVLISRTLLSLFRQVKSSEILKAEVLESALDAIIGMDHRGIILEFNPAAEKIFKIPRALAIGQEMAKLIMPEDLREAHRKGLAKYLATGIGPLLNQRIELRALQPEGTEFDIELSVTRLQVQGPPKFTGFLRDITKQKATEVERLRAIRSRDELVAIVSHELRNPLTAMGNSIELIRRAVSLEQMQGTIGRSLERLVVATHRMNRLTSDLLDVTKIESGHLALKTESLEINSLVREVLEIFRPLAKERQIHIEARLGPDCQEASGDRDRIIQVLSNLIHNAVKFTKVGGNITIQTRQVDGELEFQVRDTGSGIAEDQLAHVFERFWQAKSTAHQGTGLGLSIAKGIIEAHGGKIWTESKVGVGSSFAFRLPLAAVKKAAA